MSETRVRDLENAELINALERGSGDTANFRRQRPRPVPQDVIDPFSPFDSANGNKEYQTATAYLFPVPHSFLVTNGQTTGKIKPQGLVLVIEEEVLTSEFTYHQRNGAKFVNPNPRWNLNRTAVNAYLRLQKIQPQATTEIPTADLRNLYPIMISQEGTEELLTQIVKTYFPATTHTTE